MHALNLPRVNNHHPASMDPLRDTSDRNHPDGSERTGALTPSESEEQRTSPNLDFNQYRQVLF